MSIYCALLRGINVSGHRLIKMTDLARMFEGLGLSRVQTYIQSGNVLFESTDEAEPLRRRIEQEIATVFGFDVPVAVRTAGELERILADCPYPADDLPEGEGIYVSLLTEAPAPEGIERLLAFGSAPDEFRLLGREVYMLLRQSADKTKLTNNLLEQKLRVASTARNWRTMSKLAALAKAMEA